MKINFFIVVAYLLFISCTEDRLKTLGVDNEEYNGMVNSATRTKYSVVSSFGEIKPVFPPSRIDEYVFNKNGFIIKSSHSRLENKKTISYERSEIDSLLSETVELVQDGTTAKRKYERDSKGRLTEMVTYSPTGGIEEKQVFVLNNAGMIEKEELFDPEGRLNRRKIFTYDNKGHLITTLVYDTPYSKPTSIIKNIFEDGYLKSSRTTLRPHAVLTQGNKSVNNQEGWETIYNANGQISEKRYYEPLGAFDSHIFSYDINNNLSETREIGFDGKEISRTIFLYDLNNNIIEEKKVFSNKKASILRTYDYVYDDHRNWIKKVKSKNYEPTEIETREFIYF